MVFRRITELVEVDRVIPDLPKHWPRQPTFGISAFNLKPSAFGPFPERKRDMEDWKELSLSEEIRSFKRVRILSKLKKSRISAFATWNTKKPWNELGVSDSTAQSTLGHGDLRPPSPQPVGERDTSDYTLSGAIYYNYIYQSHVKGAPDVSGMIETQTSIPRH